VIDAFSSALQRVFFVAAPVAVLAFLLTWLMKEIPLRTHAHRPSVGAEDLEGEPLVAFEAPGEFGM